MPVKKIAELGLQAGKQGIDALSELGSEGIDALASGYSSFNELIEKAILSLTPIDVPVYCVPNGININNYEIDIDVGEIENALEAGRYVRPNIKVYAASDDLDKEILTNRLYEALVPIVERLEHEIDMKKFDQHSDNKEAGILGSILPYAFEALLLMGSAAIAPLLWIVVGIAGVTLIAALPDMLLNSIKRRLKGFIPGFRSDEEKEIDSLESEKETVEKTLKLMVKYIKIEIDDELVDLRRTFL